MNKVDAQPRAPVSTRGGYRPWVAEAANVVLHHLRLDALSFTQKLTGKGADPVAGVSGDHVFGDAVPGGQEEPLVIRRGRGPRHVAKDMPGRQDVQDSEPGDGAGMVQDQPMGGAGAAIVTGQLELPEAELAHEPRLVAGHGPLGIDQSRGVWGRLGGVAIAAQVGQHDRVILGERGANVTPDEMVLRIAVQQQQRPARPPDGTVDGDALDVYAPVLEAGQPQGGGRGVVFPAGGHSASFQ